MAFENPAAKYHPTDSGTIKTRAMLSYNFHTRASFCERQRGGNKEHTLSALRWKMKGLLVNCIASSCMVYLQQQVGSRAWDYESPYHAVGEEGVARVFIAIRRLKHRPDRMPSRNVLGSEGSYRDQAFEASMLIRKAIATSVPRDVIAVRRLKHPEVPYHKNASLWSFEAPERHSCDRACTP